MLALKRALFNCNIRSRFISLEDRIRILEKSFAYPILFGQEGNDLIARLIAADKPLMVSRLGIVELWCLDFYLKHRAKKNRSYPEKIKHTIAVNAGFFPAEDDFLDRFAELYLKEIPHIDLMGLSFNYREDFICNTYCKSALLMNIESLDAFLFKSPWSSQLAGKRVLVVHPFVESIARQYREKRHLLFQDPSVLPEFQLSTVKAVQSIGNSKVGFRNWFEAYEHMCAEMAKGDFDIAIIGAGAYGLPLASFAKRLGKQAIHLGGATQILFGVKGRRWEKEYADSTATLFNEHWVRPSASEIPEGHGKVESGCYW